MASTAIDRIIENNNDGLVLNGDNYVNDEIHDHNNENQTKNEQYDDNNDNENNHSNGNNYHHHHHHYQANGNGQLLNDENGQRIQTNGTKTNQQMRTTKNINKGSEDERKLFVGGLTWETTKDDLIKYFTKFGAVEDANIKTDLSTGRSRGFGFVLFESKEIVESILKHTDHMINGKLVDPKPAKHKGPAPVKKIFIGGLDPNFPESELRDYFSRFGKIEEVELPFDKQKNQRRAFCFISFDSEDVVNEIIKRPKHNLGGKEVDVKKATPPKEQNQFVQSQWNQLQNWSSFQTFYPQNAVYTGNVAQINGGYAAVNDAYYQGYTTATSTYTDPSYQNFEYTGTTGTYAEYDTTANTYTPSYEVDETGYYNAAQGVYDQNAYYQGTTQTTKPSKKYLNQNYHPYHR